MGFRGLGINKWSCFRLGSHDFLFQRWTRRSESHWKDLGDTKETVQVKTLRGSVSHVSRGPMQQRKPEHKKEGGEWSELRSEKEEHLDLLGFVHQGNLDVILITVEINGFLFF